MTKHRTRAFSPQNSKSHDIEKIISAPLIAASHANSMMQKEQTSFMMDVGFEESNGRYEPVMIEMVLVQQVMDESTTEGEKPVMKPIETSFKIPILTIMPLNSLAVDKVNVQFEMEIHEQVVKEQNYGKTSSSNFGQPSEKTQLKGKISYDSKEDHAAKNQYKRQNSSSLKVDVQAAPLPLPVGVHTILDLYQKAIHPIEINDKKKINI